MASPLNPALRSHFSRAADAFAVVVALAYFGVMVKMFRTGVPLWAAIGVMGAPLLVGALVLLRRAPLSRTQQLALTSVAVGGGALFTAIFAPANPQLALAVPGVAVAGIICARFPLYSLVGIAAITASFGSAYALFSFPSQKAADALLIGLWVAALWGWLVGTREPQRPRAVVWPGILLILAFVLLTAAEILLADQLIAGMQSFRASVWYLAVVLLIALAPWPEHVRPAAIRGVMLVALAAGAYATFRWAVGPSGSEEALARQTFNNFLNGELRPVAPFYTTKELAAFMAMTIPFVGGMALVSTGRWRLIAGIATLVCITGMVAADVRAGPAAAVPGVICVLVLYQAAQGFRGRRGPAVPIAVVATMIAGAGAFAMTIGSENDSGARYRAILDPADDASYQARVIKWRAALDEIEEAPLGHGLGTSGRAQQRYGRYVNVSSIDVDNSYLKIAHEQGFFVLGLFAAGILLLFLGLVRRAIVSLDPARAGPAIAACGTLVSMLVLFWVGTYIEGLPALWGWIIVGLGVSQFTIASMAPGPAAADRPG